MACGYPEGAAAVLIVELEGPPAAIAAVRSRLGLEGSPTWVDKVFSPPARGGGARFEGEAADVVEAFIKAAQENQLIQ